MIDPYIVFVGTQSVGKTTVVKELIPLLEKRYGKEVKYISEVARSVQARGFKINKEATADTQRLIEDEYKRLEDLHKDCVRVADRSVVDRFAYTLGGDVNCEGMAELMLWYSSNIPDICKGYNYIFHIPLTNDIPLTLDGVRSSDEKFRKEIDELQKNIIETYGVKVYTLQGTTEQRIATILEVLEREEKNATVIRDTN